MSYYRVPSGSNLVLNVLLGDGATNKFPIAKVFNDSFVEIPASPISLSHVSSGLYSNLSISVPDGRYLVIYITYDDPGHVTLSAKYNRSMDVFDVNDIIDVNAIATAVWELATASHQPSGSFGELVGVDNAGIATLLSRLTAPRASNLDNLNAPISGLPNATQVASAVWDASAAAHQAVGTFGSRLDTNVASRESEAYAGQRQDQTIQGIGDLQNIVIAVGADVSTVNSKVTSIKSKTDQFTFSGANVMARANVVDDKSGYALSAPSVEQIVDAVWDEPTVLHLDPGTTGEALDSADPVTTAAAVWNEARSAHTAAGSFGQAIQGVITPTRAANLDMLDAPVSSRQSESAAAMRAAVNTNLHGDTQNLVVAVSTKLGTPAGASVSADIAAVKSSTNNIQSVIGVPSSSSISGDISNIDTKIEAINTALGYTGSSVYADLGIVKAAVAAVKLQTDKMTFSGLNILSEVAVNNDKTGYFIDGAQLTILVNEVWDTLAAAHTDAGSFGKLLQDVAAGADPAAISDAVWESLTAAHATPNTFGDLVQATNHCVIGDIKPEILDGNHGLAAIRADIDNQTGNIIAEINQNEVKIDAIIPAIGASQSAIVAEVVTCEGLVNNLDADVAAMQAAIIAQFAIEDGKLNTLQSSVGAIQNNTTVRFVVPERIIKPTSGSKNYQFHLRLYDEMGNPEAPDSAPTIRIRRLDTGVDVVVAGAMTQDGIKVGSYFYDYVVNTSSFLAPLLVEATVIENGVTKYIPATSEVTEFESDLTAVQAAVFAVDSKVTVVDSRLTDGATGLAAIKSGEATILGSVAAVDNKLTLVKAVTDALPTNIATQPDVAAVGIAVGTKPSLAQIQSAISTSQSAVMGPDNRNLTQVYDHFDLSPVAKTTDPRFANLDAAISSRGTLTAAQVWSFFNRELTAHPSLDADSIKAIWDYLVSQATTPNSVGKLLVDNIDAKISTRAVSAEVQAALAGVAQEATLASVEGNLTTEINENQILLNAITSAIAAVAAKTGNLPSDPASESAILSDIAALASPLTSILVTTGLIKAKTDNLPADPARQANVLAIPLDGLSSTDSRLNKLANLDVAVSSVMPSDISSLATKTDLNNAMTTVVDSVTNVQTVVDATSLRTIAVKAKTDNLPVHPASTEEVIASRDTIIEHVDALHVDELTAAEVWNYSSRTITQDPSTFGPDISALATSAELSSLAQTQYVNKMSTVFSSTTGKQKMIVWAEKDGQKVIGSNCEVEVFDELGTSVWSASQVTCNVDGIFRFEETFSTPISQNYYAVIGIVVDGTLRVNNQSFFTVF